MVKYKSITMANIPFEQEVCYNIEVMKETAPERLGGIAVNQPGSTPAKDKEKRRRIMRAIFRQPISLRH